MRRLPIVIGLIAAAGLIVGGLTWISRRPAGPRWNVLLITLDTTRADRLGCYGAGDAQTPALDELARRGILFERAYASVPLTLPSHATMFTGLLPPEHGVRVNGTHRLDDKIPTLAEQLSAQGYRTGAFLGAFVLHRRFGLNRGFQKYDDEFQAPVSQPNLAHGGHDHAERPGADVVDAALQWLKQPPPQPFFCWVHLFDPHLPYQQHEELFGPQFESRPYDAELAYVDLQVRRLIDFLQASSRGERTVIVVAGDHGESLGEHREQTHGYTLYNATLHVPLLISCPALFPAAQRISEPVSLVDLAPTLRDLLGTPQPAWQSGRSLVAACRGESLSPRACYLETQQPFEEAGWSPQFGLVTKDWKYIRSPRPELYHLADDPGELTNLAERQRTRLHAMEAQLVEREGGLVTRTAPPATLSSAEHRQLAGLGYAGGGGPRPDDDGRTRADIKDRIDDYNRFIAAVRLLHAGELEQAEAELAAVVAAVPDYFKAQYDLGVCQMRRKKFAEAEQTFERAVAIDANATALISLAKARLSRNRPVEALSPLRQALEIQPDSPEIRFLLDDAHRRAATGR